MDLSQLLLIKLNTLDNAPLENSLLESTFLNEAATLTETPLFADIMTAAIVKEMDNPSLNVVAEPISQQSVEEELTDKDKIEEEEILTPIALPVLENPLILTDNAGFTTEVTAGDKKAAPLLTVDASEDSAPLFTEIETQLAEIETAHKMALPLELENNAMQEDALLSDEVRAAEQSLSKSTNKQSQPEISTAVVNAVKAEAVTVSGHNPALTPIATDSAMQQVGNVKELIVATPITQAEWGEHFNDQIVWLGQQKINSALIKIHPEELGPIEVTVKVVKEEASVAINTHNSVVRDMLEQAVPRLKEMLADQGVNLTQVNIESNKQQQQQQSIPQQPARILTPQEEEVPLAVTDIKKPQGMIDYFA